MVQAVEGSDNREFTLTSQGSEAAPISVRVLDVDGEVRFEGLPDELKEFLGNFNAEEMLENPVVVVKSIIRMQAMLTHGMGGLFNMIADEDWPAGQADEEQK